MRISPSGGGFAGPEATPPWWEQVLDTVADFQQASIELVAWELSLPPTSLEPAWARAVGRGLLEPVGPDPETHELNFRLTAPPGPEEGLDADSSRSGPPANPAAPPPRGPRPHPRAAA